jgi:hypothetical protein
MKTCLVLTAIFAASLPAAPAAATGAPGASAPQAPRAKAAPVRAAGVAAPVAAAATAVPAPRAQTAHLRVIVADDAEREMAELEARGAALREKEAQLVRQLDAAGEGDRERREALMKELETLRKRLLDDGSRKELLQKMLAEARQHAQFFSTAFRPVPEIRVDLELENAAPPQALKQLFERAKQEFSVEGELPQEPRVTLRAKNVRFDTALDLVTQAAGIGWTRTPQGPFKVGKSVTPHPFSRVYLAPARTAPARPAAPRAAPAPPQPLQPLLLNPAPGVFSLRGTLAPEERATFNCPHCKGQATVVRKVETPKCTKCAQPFQASWQFCPKDGAKRPEPAREWRFCPMCGKEVRMERSEGMPEDGEVVLLGAVAAPGALPLTGGLRLRDALARAGGTTGEADRRRVLILHRNRIPSVVDLCGEPRPDEEEAGDPLLRDGDAVFVPAEPGRQVETQPLEEPDGASLP